jgi:hypothetical protein
MTSPLQGRVMKDEQEQAKQNTTASTVVLPAQKWQNGKEQPQHQEDYPWATSLSKKVVRRLLQAVPAWFQRGGDIENEEVSTNEPTTASPSNATNNEPTNATPSDAANNEEPTTASPSDAPTEEPTSASPSDAPTDEPTTASPSDAPTDEPTTASPSDDPTATPTNKPTAAPTNKLTAAPTLNPTAPPTNIEFHEDSVGMSIVALTPICEELGLIN